MNSLDLLTFALFLLAIYMLLKATNRKRTVRHRSRPKQRTESAFCIRAIDGDTIEVVVNGKVERVRYIGMNAPEVGESGFHAATEANRQLVAGRTIKMQRDRSNRDKYGRLLRYVWVGKTFVNAKLVKMGKATVMVVAPNVRRIHEIAR